MKATLTLRAPILTKGINHGKLAAAVYNSAAELEADIKTNDASSVPTGRTYRRTAIVRMSNRRTQGLKLRKKGDKVIVGYKFHRASRPGQPPAIDTGRLINSIKSRRTGPLSAAVASSVPYALPLDDPQGLNRPFFQSRAILYQPRFFENVRVATLG